MTNQPPLNPDAPDSQVSEYQRVEVIETPARDYPSHGSVTIRLYHSERQSTAIQIAERTAESLRDQLNGYVAVAQPVVNSVEELDALPVGTVLRDRIGWIWEIQDVGEFITTGSEYDSDIQEVNRPAHVLYRPVVKS